MKLSKYAETIGISYDTALSHFNKGMIPGAYKLQTGTIIVPDIVADDTTKAALDVAETPNTIDVSTNEDGTEVKKKPKTQQDALRAQLEAMAAGTTANNPGFSPQDFMNAGSILPKNSVKSRDYEQEWSDALVKCTYKIEAIVSNFIQDDAQLTLPKVQVMIEEHAEKLCELDFVTKSVRETLFKLKEALDSGEPVERAFELQSTYLTQLKDTSNNRAKHLESVERYWAMQAERLGIQDEQAKVAEEQHVVDNDALEQEEKLYTKDGRGMNEDLEEILKKLKEEGFGKH